MQNPKDSDAAKLRKLELRLAGTMNTIRNLEKENR